MKLNLGCCDRHLPGYRNVDIMPPADEIVDLNNPWPWPDSSVEHVVAHDVFEHLYDRIPTMNELWRVLKPGARAEIVVPNAARGAGHFQDPTHVSPWCLNTWQYFDVAAYAFQRFRTHYGIAGGFRVVSLAEKEFPDYREPVWKITAVIEAVK